MELRPGLTEHRGADPAGSPTLEIKVLGSFDVIRDGVPVSVGGPLPRAVLARLVVSEGPVPVDQLVEDVWAGHAPPRAGASLHAYVSRLRQVLGSEIIQRRGTGYVLDRGRTRVDSGHFERCLRDGRQSLALGDIDAAVRDLGAAVACWRGAQAFGPHRHLSFLQPEAQRLEELRLTAVEELVDAHTRLGHPERDVPVLLELVAEKPLRESLVVRLMRALAASGRAAEALAVFEASRRLLAEELGVTPGVEMRAEHARLLSLPTGPTPWRLPSRNRSFTGRSALIARAEQVLGRDGNAPRLLALYGLPGVGKTELALEIAHRRRREGRLAWWMAGDGSAAVTTGLADLARALGVPQRMRQEDLLPALWDELGRRGRWLIVFDNVDDAGLLTSVLPPTGNGEVIVTSRNPAWRSLGVPLQVHSFDREESRAFLSARSGETDDRLLDALSEALADLPLALEHACAYLDQTGIGLAQYLQLLARHSAAMFTAGPAATDRPSVAHTWAVAFERVRNRSRGAAEMLETLAFLAPDAVPVRLFLGTGQDELAVNEQVAELLRLSLVDRQLDVLRTHRLVQAFARAWLTPEETADRLGVAIRLVAAAAESRRPEDWGDLVPQVLTLTDHLVECDGRHPLTARLLQLAVPIGLWLADRSLFPAALDQLTKAVRLARSGGDRVAEGIALSAFGEVLDRSGDLEAARAQLTAAIEVLEAVITPPDARLAHAHNRLGHVLNCAGDWTAAVASHRTAIDLLHGTDTTAQRARVLTDLGYTHWGAGDLDPARAAFDESLGLLAGLPDERPLLAHTIAGRGLVDQDAGVLEDALRRQRQALDIFTAEFGPLHPDVAQSYDKLGYVQRLMGDTGEAVASHERAVTDLEIIFGARDPRVAMASTNAGLAYRAAARYREARLAQERAHRIFRATYGETHPSTLFAARRLAVAWTEDGAPEVGRPLVETVYRTVRAGRGADSPETARAEADLAFVLDAMGETEAARAHRRHALHSLAAQLGPDHPEVTGLADLLAERT